MPSSNALAAGLALFTGFWLSDARAAAPVASSQSIKALADCRAIADPTARLACYDRDVSALIAAQQKGDVVVADRAEIREAKKGLFGFSLPNIKLFGNDEVSEVETTLINAKMDANGQWQFAVESGGVWRQIDTESLVREPKPGAKIVIQRAALGSFRLKVGAAPALRVRRVQ